MKPDGFEEEAPSELSGPCTWKWPKPTGETCPTLAHFLSSRGEVCLHGPSQEEEGAGPSHKQGTPPRLWASRTPEGNWNLWRPKSLQDSNSTNCQDLPKSWASEGLPGGEETPQALSSHSGS